MNIIRINVILYYTIKSIISKSEYFSIIYLIEYVSLTDLSTVTYVNLSYTPISVFIRVLEILSI